MKIGKLIVRVAAALLFSTSGVGIAANALIVHDGTAGIEANALGNLSTLLTAATFTVTPSVGVPGGSLAGYQQIWDIRFNNTTPLSGSDISAYLTFLSGGGSLFVMGENMGFATRNNSIVTLVGNAGGGALVMATALNAQDVDPPFNGPNPAPNMTYLAAAGSQTYGSGTWVTRDANAIASAIVWQPGALATAPAGTLITVFDVNFMDPGSSPPPPSQQFLQNLIGYLAAPGPVGPVPVPSLAIWGMIALGLALAAAAVKLLGFRAA